MKLVSTIILLTILFACDFHFGMEDLHKGTCIKEINSTYVSGKNTKFTIYRVEAKQSDSYTVSIWHNRSWLFLKTKPRDYFVDGKIFKYEQILCPDQERVKKGMKEKIKALDLWKK